MHAGTGELGPGAEMDGATFSTLFEDAAVTQGPGCLSPGKSSALGTKGVRCVQGKEAGWTLARLLRA